MSCLSRRLPRVDCGTGGENDAEKIEKEPRKAGSGDLK